MSYFRQNIYGVFILTLFLIIFGAGCSSNSGNSSAPSLTLEVTTEDTGYFHLTWKASNLNVSYYKLYRKIDSEDYQLIFSYIDSNSNMTREGFFIEDAGKKTVYYKISAICYNNIQMDAEASTLYIKAGIPAAPTLLAANANTWGVVFLNWNDNSGNETEFVLQRKTGIDGIYSDIVVSRLTSEISAHSVVNYTDRLPDMNPSLIYYYRVKSRNPYGESIYTNEIMIKTTGNIGVIIE